MECDDVCPAVAEGGVERPKEFFLGRIIGPHGKNPARMQVPCNLAKAIGSVKRFMPRVQPVSRRMIDIQQDGVKSFAGIFRIETAGVHQSEEVTLHQPATRIGPWNCG